MLGVYYIMARIIITKYAHEFKQCEMLESLATTSVHCWLTHARLVRKLHGSVYLGFKCLLFFTNHK